MLKITAQNKGIVLAVITALVSGLSIYVNKFAVSVFSPPLFFTGAKNLLVAIALVSIFLLSKQYKNLYNANKKDFLLLLLIGLIGGYLPFWLFFTGISQTSAINSVIIQKTLVLWVAILAVPLLKENLSKKQGFAILLLFCSNLVLGGFKGLEFTRGEFYILLSSILWAVETIIAKKALKKFSASLLATARMSIGSVLLLVTAFLTSAVSVKPSVGIVEWLVVLSTVLFLFVYVNLWYSALKHASAIFVSTILVGSTIVTNILTIIFGGNSFDGELIIQILLIAAGISLMIKSHSSKNPDLKLA